MCPKEVAQPHKGPDSIDIGGWFVILDSFEFVLSGFDSIRCECKTKVLNFLVSKNTFVQVYFQVIFVQPGKNLVQYFKVLFVSVGVHQQVIVVDQQVLDVAEYSFH